MKFVGGSTGLFVAILVVIMTLFIQTEANWYGKRGNKVDDTLFKLLEGNVLRMSERQQMETQITLWAIRDKVDDTLFQLLEGNVPSMSERQQMDAQMTLRAISKLISDYQLRQFEHAEGKPVTRAIVHERQDYFKNTSRSLSTPVKLIYIRNPPRDF